MTVLPTVLRRESGTEELFVLTPEPDNPAFLGHFPGDPILPGVIQVDWAILGDFKGLSNLKFTSIIRPGECLELHLALDRPAGRLEFRYDGPLDRKSSGMVIFSIAG